MVCVVASGQVMWHPSGFCIGLVVSYRFGFRHTFSASLSFPSSPPQTTGSLRTKPSPVCDKRFNRPSSLNTHMSVHTGAKRESGLVTLCPPFPLDLLPWPSSTCQSGTPLTPAYQCLREGCGRRFSVSSNLRRHERVSP